MHNDQRLTLGFAIHAGEAPVRRASLTGEIVRLGSDRKNQLRIDDPLAGQLHAVIEASARDKITLIDLGSDAGTRVNGARIHKHALSVGDAIEIGATRVVLERVEHAAAERIESAAPFAASPFAAGGPSAWDASDGPSYRVVPATPPVPDSEIDSAVRAVEIRLSWGTSLLHVEHRDAKNAFYLGETDEPRCDFLVPAEKLGRDRAPLVLPEGVVLLPGAVGTLTLSGEPAMRLEEAVARGLATPCTELAGAHLVGLRDGMRVRQHLGDLVFEVGAVKKARRVGAALTMAAVIGGAGLYVLGSLAAHAGMLAALASFTPPLGATQDDTLTDGQRHLLQYYLEAAAEEEKKARETEQLATADPSETEGGTGTRAIGEEGKMGDASSTERNKGWAVAGPPDNPDPHIGRQAALDMARDFGMVGLLNGGAGVDPNTPTAFWGRQTAEGRDPLNALGNMWADDLGNAWGAGGLGLTGIGEGGGGRGEGIGLGDIGTLGRGQGMCDSGTCDGFGRGSGAARRGHGAGAPRVRMAVPSLSGRLPPEVIQRIVRQNFGRFRYCYENGLRNQPTLQGRVAVSFVIGRDGRVSNVSGGGDLPDTAVTSCITRAFYGLSFPQPEGGIVTVTYPIVLTPGG